MGDVYKILIVMPFGYRKDVLNTRSGYKNYYLYFFFRSNIILDDVYA